MGIALVVLRLAERDSALGVPTIVARVVIHGRSLAAMTICPLNFRQRMIVRGRLIPRWLASLR